MNKKKKVLHLVEAMGGGVFTYLVELANGMSDEFDVSIAFGMRKKPRKTMRTILMRVLNLLRLRTLPEV